MSLVRIQSPLPFFRLMDFVDGMIVQTKQSLWEFSSAGRASALQAGGHRFEPCNSHQFGQVVQLVRMPACHAGGRRFEPDLGRQFFPGLPGYMVGIGKRLSHRVVAPICVGSNPTTHPILFIGVSPSGKATDSDSVMRRFESCYPSQLGAWIPRPAMYGDIAKW